MAFKVKRIIENNIGSEDEPVQGQCAKPAPHPEGAHIAERKPGIHKGFDKDVADKEAAQNKEELHPQRPERLHKAYIPTDGTTKMRHIGHTQQELRRMRDHHRQYGDTSYNIEPGYASVFDNGWFLVKIWI